MKQILLRPHPAAFSAGPAEPALAAGSGKALPSSPALPVHSFARLRMTDSEPAQSAEGEVQREESGQEASGEDLATADVSSIVAGGLASGGRPLDPDTRAFMEPRFGHDFSQVRVHDNPQASSSAQSVAARAYTVGSNIAFRSGEFAPGSGEGRRLLAHELTHVVQQGAASPLAPSVQRYRVQRYQAGDTGHGKIEQDALKDVGFKPDEASQAYFGNWMRDLSQVPHKALPLINVLSLGEFNRPVDEAQLGVYVPSEHLDNPLGGGTIEDGRLDKPALTGDAADAECAKFNMMKPQCDAFKQEESHRDEILHASTVSHLPPYIEVGKFHAKETLKQAVAAKETPEGRALLGNALHAVEDYFSHSNFVEACIMTLQKEGAGGPKVAALAANLKKTTLGENAVTFDAQNAPQIVTGTYKPGGNDWVSRLELLKSEIEHGQLTKAFMVGLLRAQGVDIGTGLLARFLQNLPAVVTLEVIAAGLAVLGYAVNHSTYLTDLKDSIIEAGTKLGTDISHIEAPVDPKTGKAGPTHSELAKDAPDNALFGISAHLAGEVDKQFGTAVKAAWGAGQSNPDSPEAQTLLALVDKFVSVPATDPWWRDKIVA